MKKCIMVLTTALLISQAQAATLLVPDQYRTIQAAIVAIGTGDSILIAPGIYEGFYALNSPSHITLLGAGAFTLNPTIVRNGPTCPGYTCVRIENVFGWEVGQFRVEQPLSQAGSGVELWNADSSWIHHVDVAQILCPQGISMLIHGTDNTTIERCLVRSGAYDLVSMWTGGPNNHLTLRNITASAAGNGFINRATEPYLDIRNCLAFGCGHAGFKIQFWQSTYGIYYNDAYDNDDGNYVSFTPDPSNMLANPMVLGVTGWQGFLLRPGSWLIDAGDPNSALDPDGTRADIGCFYFDQDFQYNQLILELEPQNPPIIIPPYGGGFTFTISMTHPDSLGFLQFDAWYGITDPNGQTLNPILLKTNLLIYAGQTIQKTLFYYLGPDEPAGIYTVEAYMGDYPDSIYVSDSFTVEKASGDSRGFGPGGSSLTDGEVQETFTFSRPFSALTPGLGLQALPNPFNPTTVASFELRVASYVSLKVYDTAGRLVGTVVNGWREAGEHRVTFDGSKLAAGVYVFRLEASGLGTTPTTMTGKMVLLK